MLLRTGMALILVGKKESSYAAVGFCDDPERVVSITFARLGLIDGIGGQDAPSCLHRLVVGLRVLLADTAPVATHVAFKAAVKQ